jgi:hypothetical protein
MDDRRALPLAPADGRNALVPAARTGPKVVWASVTACQAVAEDVRAVAEILYERAETLHAVAETVYGHAKNAPGTS